MCGKETLFMQVLPLTNMRYISGWVEYVRAALCGCALIFCAFILSRILYIFSNIHKEKIKLTRGNACIYACFVDMLHYISSNYKPLQKIPLLI